MGYEGHDNSVLDRLERRAAVERAMLLLLLLLAHEQVGGDVVSAGGTMTAELNEWVTEVQAGTYVLMDTAFDAHVPFDIDIWIVSDEHVTFAGLDVSVGDRVRLLPAHLDPTVATHDRMWVLDGDEVVDEWPVDLGGW